MATSFAETEKLTDIKFGYFVPIREADGMMVDDKAGVARVVIITEGLGNLRDRNYYAKSAVESCVQVFAGKQFYVDHPSKDDEENRPERTMRDLAGYFFDTSLGMVPDLETGDQLSACFASLKFAMEAEPGRLAFAQVKAAIEYQKRFPGSKDVYCGISINGGGVSHPDQIGGLPVNMVTEIKEAFSADIVTKPARGGKFLAVFTEAQKEMAEYRRQLALGVRATEAAERARGLSRQRSTNMREKLTEARKAVADEAKKAMLTGDGLTGIGDKMSKLVAAINEPPEDPDDLIADIQGDLDALDSLLDDVKSMKQQAEAKRKAAEQEAKMAKQDEAKKAAEDEQRRKAGEGERKTGEDERKRAGESEDERRKAGEDERRGRADEGEKKTDEDERKKTDEDEQYADEGDDVIGRNRKDPKAAPMDDHDDAAMSGRDVAEDDDENGNGMQPHVDMPVHGDNKQEKMTYTCAACAAENEVSAPKGYRLVASEQYATESNRGVQDLVARLRRSLESKEARFMKSNEQTRSLMQELIKLRAENTAFKRVAEAKKRLIEAKIPRDVLSPTDLLAFEPHQWDAQIKAAQRVLTKEAQLVSRGGNPARDAGIKGDNERGADAAIKTFKEALAR